MARKISIIAVVMLLLVGCATGPDRRVPIAGALLGAAIGAGVACVTIACDPLPIIMGASIGSGLGFAGGSVIARLVRNAGPGDVERISQALEAPVGESRVVHTSHGNVKVTPLEDRGYCLQYRLEDDTGASAIAEARRVRNMVSGEESWFPLEGCAPPNAFQQEAVS